MHIVVNVRKYKHTVQTPICRLTEPERAQDAAPSALLKAEKKANNQKNFSAPNTAHFPVKRTDPRCMTGNNTRRPVNGEKEEKA